MMNLYQKLTPILVVFVALFLASGSVLTDTADARSRGGGRSFKSAPAKAPVTKAPASQAAPKKSGGFGKALAGGLLGGAIGTLLFGSLFGGEGGGFGLLPFLLLGGVGFFLYRRFAAAKQAQAYAGQGTYGSYAGHPGADSAGVNTNVMRDVPPAPPGSAMAVEEGLAQIRSTDAGFDQTHFSEVASDVFFQVQAGWGRRDLDSYRHLLGDQLARDYEAHFAEMREKGIINKIESIAVRRAEICAAGSTGNEDFVTVLFTASLLDYTVNDTTGDLVEGSMTAPVKFAEEWTWARPVGTENWKLEGIRDSEQ